MSFPHFIDLITLDAAFNGEPFCNVATRQYTVFTGMETGFLGEPFAGTVGSLVSAARGAATVSGRVAGVHLSAPGAIKVSAAAGNAQASGAGVPGWAVSVHAQMAFIECTVSNPFAAKANKYYADYAGLDTAFLGEPYCSIAASDIMDLATLNYFYLGEPFSGTVGPKDRTARAVTGLLGAVFSAAYWAARSPEITALMEADAACGQVVPVVVCFSAASMVCAGSCVQVGRPTQIIIYAPPAIAGFSSMAGYKGAAGGCVGVLVLTGTVSGVVPASCRIAGGIGGIPIEALAAINPAYKGLEAAPAVLIADIPETVPVVFVRCLPLFGIDLFTKISLHLDGNFSDSSSYNRTPTVFNGAAANVPGYFGQGGSFREPKDVVEYPHSLDWSFLTGDFNISFRFKPQEALVWQINGQYYWTIASCLKTEWEAQLPYDPMFPERGTMWGNGWYLMIDDVGFGPRVVLTGRRSYIQYGAPPYQNTYSVQYEYVNVLQNVMPSDQVGFLPPVLLGEWITVVLGRAGGRGYIVIDGEEKPILQDFSLDDGLSAMYSGFGNWSEGPWKVYPEAPLTVGGMSPGNADPFLREVFPAALGTIDEFQIDKGICRNFMSCPEHPDPLVIDSGSLGLIGGMLSGVTGGVSGFPTVVGARRGYECVLDGAGLGPVVIPITQVICRLHDGAPSYTEIQVPGLLQMDEILARKDGNITVFALVLSSDGSVERQREEICTSPVSQVIITGNDNDQSMTLSGYRDVVPNAYPKTTSISGLTYTNWNNGQRRFRSSVIDMYIRPGDTVVYGDEEFIAGSISFYISSKYACSMEIAEG